MAVRIRLTGSDDSDALRHWSTVDLWSDGQRRPIRAEIPVSVDMEEKLAALREAEVGVDIPVPLSISTQTDGELLKYLMSPALSGWTYHYLRLGCSFRNGRGERFTGAELSVRLTRSDPGDEQPAAWSMTPLTLLDGDDRTDTLTVGADLKFVKGEKARQTKATQGTLVRAYGLLTANPAWRFTPTRIRDLEGSFQLGLIVRSPVESRLGGDVALNVVVEKPRRLAPVLSATVKGAKRLEVSFQGGGQSAAVRELV